MNGPMAGNAISNLTKILKNVNNNQSGGTLTSQERSKKDGSGSENSNDAINKETGNTSAP
jgi:hypothetical protein